MSKVILDASMRAKLNGLTQKMELYDEEGNLLGYCTPLVDSLMGEGSGMFSDEEIAEAMNDTDEGWPLEDILRDLGSRRSTRSSGGGGRKAS